MIDSIMLRGPVIRMNMAIPDRVANVVSSLEIVNRSRATKRATVNGQIARAIGSMKSSRIVGFLSSGPAKMCFSLIEDICSSDKAMMHGTLARAKITSIIGSISGGIKGSLNIFVKIEARVSNKNIATGKIRIIPLDFFVDLLLASMTGAGSAKSELISGLGSGALGVATGSLVTGGFVACIGLDFGFIRLKPLGLSEEGNH